MGWLEVMQELETKLEGTLKGTYRPQDNVPFFRVQYPPSEEREAIRQFRLLAERLRQKGWQAECVSLVEVFQQALARLVGCSLDNLPERLKELERSCDRTELQRRLADPSNLPSEIAEALKERLAGMPRESVAILLRMGALYPFIRSSSLEVKLEGQIRCAVVLPYPGITLGALLDTQPATSHGGFYRGEVIRWQ